MEWSAERLRALSLSEAMELFSSLEPPAVEEMQGEFKADLLDHGSLLNNAVSRLVLYNPLGGWWLGKAFSGAEGHGYNSFRRFGKVVRKYRMRTLVAPSRFDGRDAFQLIYRAYDSTCGRINMVDEVRRVRDGLHLGVGTWGFTDKQRLKPLPFSLSGPVGPFVGSDRPENL